jgi:small subunit ribosomal protein S4e
MHQKRNEVPRNWPIKRKGTKFIAVASHSEKGIPLVVLLRDILKVARTMKEVRFMTIHKEVKVNTKLIKDEKFPLALFDILTLDKIGKSYRMEIVNKKLKPVEISGKETDKKTVKIIGKKILSKEETQINLGDGRNFITKEKFNVGDSALIELKGNKIEKIIALKPGVKVKIVVGKHAGKEGKLKEIKNLEREKRYSVKMDTKGKESNAEINLPLKAVLAVE